MTAPVARPFARTCGASIRRALLGVALAIAALAAGFAPLTRAADTSRSAQPLNLKTRQVLRALVLADAFDFLEGRRSALDRYYHRPRPLFMTNEQAQRLTATDGAQLEALTADRDVLLVGIVVRVVPSIFSHGYRIDMRGGGAELEDEQFGNHYGRQLSPGQRVELVCHGASGRMGAFAFYHCGPAHVAAALMDELAMTELMANAGFDPAAARLIANAQLAADQLPADSHCYAVSDPALCLRQIANLERRAPARDASPSPAAGPQAVADADIYRPPVSIDCGAPASNGQRILCGDVDLFAREVALRQLFDTVQLAAYARSVDASKALVAAHAASSAERDACNDRACVSAWFDNREAQLAQVAAGPK